jgi:pyruvate dehydrogenase E2 component (dihydrolipoamide acetyltransferase)
MATEFKLPDLGENIASGDVVSVHVSEGDVVKPGQAILEVETDKAVIEVPCPPGGRIAKVLVKKGETVKVGQTLVLLEAAGSAAPVQTKPVAPAAAPTATQPVAPPPAAVPAKPAPVAAPAAPAPAAVAPAENGVRSQPAVVAATATVEPAGPAVRRLARELGVDLARVRGSGTGGRIVREDVIAAVRQASAAGPTVRSRPESGATERDDWGPIRREQMSRMRKTIAANMVRSVQTIPHLTNFDDADVTELEHLRKASAPEYAKSNLKLTALAFVIAAAASRGQCVDRPGKRRDRLQGLRQRRAGGGHAARARGARAARLRSAVDSADRPGHRRHCGEGQERPVRCRGSAGRDVHDLEPGGRGRRLFDPHHQLAGGGYSVAGPLPQDAGRA